ncbi:unnamed protein product [Protopolystoma xenopodis]|uniref:Uncharacterized protein n=1 Tax=Protopolystoma xenopodis TaxID=117903 RepID=A0A448WYD0_9PLAT|nr:unnamed protein product [Protopolystoma xenopodis]
MAAHKVVQNLRLECSFSPSILAYPFCYPSRLHSSDLLGLIHFSSLIILNYLSVHFSHETAFHPLQFGRKNLFSRSHSHNHSVFGPFLLALNGQATKLFGLCHPVHVSSVAKREKTSGLEGASHTVAEATQQVVRPFACRAVYAIERSVLPGRSPFSFTNVYRHFGVTVIAATKRQTSYSSAFGPTSVRTADRQIMGFKRGWHERKACFMPESTRFKNYGLQTPRPLLNLHEVGEKCEVRHRKCFIFCPAPDYARLERKFEPN